jgi:hypothetical protein
MRQFVTIAGNAFMELIRQPVFLLLMTLSTLFEVFLAVSIISASATSLNWSKTAPWRSCFWPASLGPS